MPELPEVETLKRSLKNHIMGHKITSFMQFRKSLRYELDPTLSAKTINSFITNVHRIAKYLVVELNNNNSIIFHLGMTGRLTLRKGDYSFQKHDHVAFSLDDGNLLVFNDARRFGMVYAAANDELNSEKYFKNIGLEPLSAEFNAEYLASYFKNRKAPIKSVISFAAFGLTWPSRMITLSAQLMPTMSRLSVTSFRRFMIQAIFTSAPTKVITASAAKGFILKKN